MVKINTYCNVLNVSLQNTEKKQVYFARKFEPIINLSIIDTLEVWLYGEYPAGNVNTFKNI